MYLVKIDDTIFPLGPSKFGEDINNGDEKLILLNEGEVTVPKRPKLESFSVELTLPGIAYPFAYYPEGFKGPDHYKNKLKALKEGRKPFLLLMTRTRAGKKLGDLSMKVLLDDASFSEDAGSGADVDVSLSFSRYRNYGTKKVTFTKKKNKTTKTTEKKRPASNKKTTNYTVKKGDCLWNIAKKKLGKSSRWKEIYKLNKSVIEKAAKKHGRKSSSNGHWIYPGTKLKLPKK